MVHWVDLSDGSAGWGLACTADAPGGYDASGPTLRLTVLRSPRVADHGLGLGCDDPVGYPVTDQGRHTARYRLTPHPARPRRRGPPPGRTNNGSNCPSCSTPGTRRSWARRRRRLHVEAEGVVVPVLKRPRTEAAR